LAPGRFHCAAERRERGTGQRFAVRGVGFKALVREQYFMLLIDPEAAIGALPTLLPDDMEARGKALALIRQVLAARGGPSGDAETRMHQIARVFTPGGEAAPAPGIAVVPPAEGEAS
jgi:hypothetical protein